MRKEPKKTKQDKEPAPSGLFWPVRRFFWFLEKYLLWPIADTFRRFFGLFRRIPEAFRYRSPFAYIGVTLMVAMTAGAIAAAVYFYNQSEDNKDGSPTVADTAVPTETIVPSVPTPTPTPTTGADTTPNSGNGDTTLQGVVPNFTTAEKQKKSGGSSNDGGGTSTGNGTTQPLPNTVVRPSPTPKSPPLRVAHNFATTFVNYEVGTRGAAKEFSKTATAKLAKELKDNPPKLPSSGQIPKATVVNVVKGKGDKNSMDVSVSLMRSGAASELRLGLTHEKGDGWLVSEVRG